MSQKNLKTTNTNKTEYNLHSYLPVIILEEMVVSEFLMLLPLDYDQETEHRRDDKQQKQELKFPL